MSFELLHEFKGYRSYAKRNGGRGFCLGMSYLWVKGLITGKAPDLSQPDLKEAQKEQRKYEGFTVSRNAAAQSGANILCQYFCFQKNVEFIKANIFCEVAEGHGAAAAMVNALAFPPDKIAILIGWVLDNRESHSADAVEFIADSGHAGALIKFGENIYFYDPNYGVFIWRSTSGASLCLDLEFHMRAMGYGLRVKILGAMKCKPGSKN